MQILRQRDVIARINVSPREIDQFLERQKKMPSESNEYNVSHILVAVPQAATPEELDEATKKADEVYQKATGGEDFGRLAVAYSNAQTALEGGSLGWRKGPELPTFLAEVIAGMKAGDVTKPIRTPSGFHILKLNEMRGNTQVIVNQVHARHILIKPNELQDDATVQQKLASIRDRILNKGENFTAVASVVSEDPGSAAEGGDLGWAGPGTFVPEFEKQLAQLQPDEISQPFRTQFGWHIIQLLGRRQFDTTAGHHPPARVHGVARIQGRRRNRAVAAAPARRGVRRVQALSAARKPIAVTAGEPAGIGPDLCLALASLALPLPARDRRQPRAAGRARAPARPRRGARSLSTRRRRRRPPAGPPAGARCAAGGALCRRPARYRQRAPRARAARSRHRWRAPAASSTPWSRRRCRRA